ncbi:MAG TPA: HAD family hydrolase [Burkholderiales bacterium]|nr:HAD family hydrolase [Burkholderiales bacterium]
MKLVLFDLDNTLLAGDSDYEWGQFLIERGILDRDTYEHQNRKFHQQYKNGVLDIHEFLEFQLHPLSQYSRAQLDVWHAEYMQAKILPMITPAARDLVESSLTGDNLVSIITATNSFVTAPIAREFGVSHLIATEPELRDGKFTGQVCGIPSFREGKITRLHQWLEGMGKTMSDFDESWFYSDSLNDLPLLENVSHPVVVNADPVLHAHAQKNGWPQISLGQPE